MSTPILASSAFDNILECIINSENQVCLVATLLMFVTVLVLLFEMKKPKDFPPGPTWFPVLGCALTVARLRKTFGGHLYKAVAILAERYGPVVGLKIGKEKIVICCEYESIKEMLSKEEFTGRPQGLCYETRTWGLRRGVILTDEEFWVEQRRFVARHLREVGFGRRTMAELVETEAEHLVTNFKNKLSEGNGKAIVEMEEAFDVFVLNTLWMMMASIRYSKENEELKTLQNILADIFRSVHMIGDLFSQFPILRYIAPELSGYKRFVKMHQRIWKFLKAEVDRHKATFRKGEPRDLIDSYLEILSLEDKASSFTESQLLAICMDMFMAGTETTSKTLGFGFLYMLLTPEVKFKVQAELDRVVGRDRLPTLQDRPNLPYTEAVTFESIRMLGTRGFGVPHRALKDTTFQGYRINKDTMLLAHFNGIFASKKLWGDPQNFRPDRFLDKDGKIDLPEFYLPFGLGKRKCMGQALARSNIFLFMSSLLQNFNFEIPPGQGPPDTTGNDGISPAPGKFYAQVTFR